MNAHKLTPNGATILELYSQRIIQSHAYRMKLFCRSKNITGYPEMKYKRKILILKINQMYHMLI